MHPEQETADLSAWKTLYLLPSLDVYDAVYRMIGGRVEYEVNNTKDSERLITWLLSLTDEGQIYELFPRFRDVIEKAYWFIKDDKNADIDNTRKNELIKEVDYYLSGKYALLEIHQIPKSYLNTSEDEYGAIFDVLRKRIVGINENKFLEHQSYIVPSTVEFIDDDIFGWNDNLKHIDLSNVRVIGVNQFVRTGLEELIVPATVESLGACICEGCRSLKRVEFRGTMNFLDIACFNGCSLLESVTLPKDLLGLSDNVFSGTQSLKSLDLPEGLRFIGGECFMGTGIKSLKIPSTVIEMAKDAIKNEYHPK